MLQGLTSQNGLPLGAKEIEMIEHARAKLDLESSMPPFTDEACLALRKKMMEMSELREFKLREKEIDAKREGRLLKLSHALHERDESNEFLASQRIEAIRQVRMAEREKVLQKIRKKRVKVLRRLAHQRNEADPVLSTAFKRDIISEYHDHSSEVYAPLKRHGALAPAAQQIADVAARTAPLDDLSAIANLESTIPKKLLSGQSIKPPQAYSSLREMSATAPPAMFNGGGGRAAQPRLTSAAHRSLRNTKRDVEIMHAILLKKKQMRTTGGSLPPEDGEYSPSSAVTGQASPSSPTRKPTAHFTQTRKPKTRPSTPDFSNLEESSSEVGGVSSLQAALVTLQRLLRGRAEQNAMFEGRVRRKELIAELRNADVVQPDYDALDERALAQRGERIRQTTTDAIAGSVTSNMFSFLANEQVWGRWSGRMATALNLRYVDSAPFSL